MIDNVATLSPGTTLVWDPESHSNFSEIAANLNWRALGNEFTYQGLAPSSADAGKPPLILITLANGRTTTMSARWLKPVVFERSQPQRGMMPMSPADNIAPGWWSNEYKEGRCPNYHWSGSGYKQGDSITCDQCDQRYTTNRLL